MKDITIVYQPTVEIIAEMGLRHEGILRMADWVKERAPGCVPEGGFNVIDDLFPHDGTEGSLEENNFRPLTANELLVELAGRKCYNSFAEKSGKKSNKEYIAHTQSGSIPHASIMYHAKMSFFIAGVSRRVSHELIRNYVGADRTEEGSPSQESTRYTEHPGFYVVHPKVHNNPISMKMWARRMQENFDGYMEYMEYEYDLYGSLHHNEAPKQMDRKRILEAASSFLSHSIETSFIWTTNPMALTKLFKERCDEAADREFQRFANKWRAICLDRWPNLFPNVVRT